MNLHLAFWFGSMAKCFIWNIYEGNEWETQTVEMWVCCCYVHIACKIQKYSPDTLAIWDRLLGSTDPSLRSAILTALEISGDWRYSLFFSMAAE